MAGMANENIVMESDTHQNVISDDTEEEETVDVRSYFPETWLWELHHSGYVLVFFIEPVKLRD